MKSQLLSKILAFSLTGALMLSSVAPMVSSAATLSNLSFSKDGQTLMVPIKDVFTKMGATVAYKHSAREITVTKGAVKSVFTLNQQTFSINGKKLALDAKVKVVNNRALVPAHAVEQMMGVKLSMNGGKLNYAAAPKQKFNVVTINGPTGVAMAQMIDNSYLGENADMSYDVMANAQLIPAKLLKGEADIAFLPTNMASIIHNKSNGEVVMLSTDIWGLLSVVTTDPAIKDWKDLKGKHIDIFGQGATPEIAFKALAESNGLNPSKDMTYKFAYDTPALLATALAGNQLKDGIAVLPEPFISLAESKNKNVRVVFEFKDEWKKANEGLGFPMSSIVVRKDFLVKHPELVTTFLREFKMDMAALNAEPKRIATIVDKRPEFNFNSSMLEKAIPRSDYRYVSAKDSKKAVEKYLKVLYDFKPETVGGKVPGDAFYAEAKLPY